MKTLILNIKQLVQTELSPRKWVAGKDMARLGILENAYLLVEEDKIAGFGKMEDLNREAVYAGGYRQGNRCNRPFGHALLL